MNCWWCSHEQIQSPIFQDIPISNLLVIHGYTGYAPCFHSYLDVQIQIHHPSTPQVFNQLQGLLPAPSVATGLHCCCTWQHGDQGYPQRGNVAGRFTTSLPITFHLFWAIVTADKYLFLTLQSLRKSWILNQAESAFFQIHFNPQFHQSPWHPHWNHHLLMLQPPA